MWLQLELNPGSMLKIVYCYCHAGISTILKMFCEIQKIAQYYYKDHPTRGMEKTKFVQISEDVEKIGVPCNTREPYHHEIQQYNDINYGKSDGSTSDKILIQHEGILKVNNYVSISIILYVGLD